MGFLAAWGLVQGFGPVWVPLGLGVCYALDALVVRMIALHGRKAAIVAALCTMLMSFLAAISTSDARWWLLCMAAGGLLAFRDLQSIHSLAWMPLRARRQGGNSILALAAGAIGGGVLLAVSMVFAGFLTHYWSALPQVIALMACVFLLPQQVWRTPSRPLQKPIQPPVHARDLSWLLRLSLLFNAVNFLGRRIVLPLAIWTLARRQGWGEDVMPLLGGALGMMGLVGMLMRAPAILSRRAHGEGLLAWGARASLLGWTCIGVGAALLDAVALAWIAFMCGWVLLEATNKTWATGYMEALRAKSVGNRLTASRAHRLSLQMFMSFKSTGGAIGCCLAALMTPAAAPWLVAAMAAGCWWWLENPPQSPDQVNTVEQ